ncbi:HTH_Tnp_Tc3_2 domain-containing protein [Trichonephila clavipes]|nr:HTH_Tnp_Tc3_2 domain-containing protein [Trichonephila clavipes]
MHEPFSFRNRQTVRDERRLGRIVRCQPKQILAQITSLLNDVDSPRVSKRTVRRSLHRMGLESRDYESTIAQCSPSDCSSCKGKSVEWSVEDWKRVAWSDESQFHEALDPACQVETVHGHGGSIIVWGVFS